MEKPSYEVLFYYSPIDSEAPKNLPWDELNKAPPTVKAFTHRRSLTLATHLCIPAKKNIHP